jgi:hypothetical protein
MAFCCDAVETTQYIAGVSDTLRGVIVFIAVLMTIGIWAPLRNKPERLPTGVIVSETYFGVLTYLTLRTQLKEPHYEMAWTPHFGRLAGTVVLTAGLWTCVIAGIRKKSSPTDRAKAQ